MTKVENQQFNYYNNFFHDETGLKSLKTINNKNNSIPGKLNFLIWFIGFSEGDGSFVCGANGQICFSIGLSQKDFAVLEYIEKELGFGNILPDDSGYRTACNFRIWNKEHLGIIIEIFNGNIVLDKVQKRFELFVNAYNKRYKTTVVIKKRTKVLDLNNPWFSGFTDAGRLF
jgi:hypothetical protein